MQKSWRRRAANISGSATLAGTLNVSLINNFSPSLGDSFGIVNYATLSGTFDAVNLPALAGGLGWDIAYGVNSIVLNVVSAPTVGGTIVLVNKLELVMPWIIVAALMVVAGIWRGIWNRRRRIGSLSGR